MCIYSKQAVLAVEDSAGSFTSLTTWDGHYKRVQNSYLTVYYLPVLQTQIAMHCI